MNPSWQKTSGSNFEADKNTREASVLNVTNKISIFIFLEVMCIVHIGTFKRASQFINKDSCRSGGVVNCYQVRTQFCWEDVARDGATIDLELGDVHMKSNVILLVFGNDLCKSM